MMEHAPLRIIVDDRERADGKVLAALALAPERGVLTGC